ncbi:hypothetical protein XBP1_270175 [Xenorhabdus bovienii str. puntauvense]|uniref:Uncharacterized protein n=2 Tax=Xenorhabdus bovienii TaxID=40576 RepID=A0A0B6X9Q3_XENBV|nr:hypothetical protein XBP1_270175 [Xenorhabdus bovienii str. puntauvense]CDM89891.1 protein of unknown function [Xenorhabdus bovienii]
MSCQQVYKIIREARLKANLAICVNPHILWHACDYTKQQGHLLKRMAWVNIFVQL